jgi:hypothetical protein
LAVAVGSETPGTNKEFMKTNKSVFVKIALVVGVLVVAVIVFSASCSCYERMWYKKISDDKLNGESYSKMVLLFGEPIYRLPAKNNAEVCVYSPYYYRFGLFARCISELRGNPVTSIVFANDKYQMVILQLGSGEKMVRG